MDHFEISKEILDSIFNEHQLKLLQEINKNNCSKVFKVQTKSNEEAILKIMYAPAEEKLIEISQLKPLNIDSPYFVKYYDSFYVKPNLMCYLMEYCDGGSVTDFIKITDRSLNEREIYSIVNQTLHGLQYLHSNHMLHNDIKAANLLFTTSGQLKISDAYVANAVFTLNEIADSTFLPAPTWKGPEYFGTILKENTELDKVHSGLSEKSDIWSLGITILEMFKKRPPNSDADAEQLKVLLEPSVGCLLPIPKDASHLFGKFVKSLIAKLPSDRPSADALINHDFVKQITLEQSKTVIKNMADLYIQLVKEKLSDDDDEIERMLSDDYEDDEDEEDSDDGNDDA